MATSLARAHSRRCSCGRDSGGHHSHTRHAKWFSAGGGVRVCRILACAVLDFCFVSPVHAHTTRAAHDAPTRSRDGLCVDRWHLYARLFARIAAHHRRRFFNRDLECRDTWHRAEDYMAGSQSFGRNVFDHRLGSINNFAVGVSPCRLYQSVAVRARRHRVHGRCDFVLLAAPTTSTARVWLSRGVARVYCCCCCSAVCWRWCVDRPRRLTPSETIVAGIKNARP